MTVLIDLAKDRDNNLNVIRMSAAVAVLVSHAWPIALGPGTAEPMKSLLDRSLGSLAVSVFFVISGYLIAESFHRTQNWQEFLLARFLRLWPGLIVSLLIAAFLLGPLVTTMSTSAYLSSPETWSFLLQNTLLAIPQYTLPGVFENQPYPTVEGSIWTLFYEVVCYIGVFIAGCLGLLARRRILTGLIVGLAAVWLFVTTAEIGLHPKIMSLISLALPFAAGTALWLWRDMIKLRLWVVVVLWGVAIFTRGMGIYEITLVAAIAYSTFWLGFVPGGIIRQYNRLGDYSYGIYIYAFPAQGLTVWLAGPMTPLENIALALPLTLVPSILSWHLIEKPALELRKALRPRQPVRSA